MNPDTLKLIETVKARRLAQGLGVRDGEWTGYFDTLAARDEFIARAKRAGMKPELIPAT